MRTPANLILAGAAGAAAVVLLVAGAGIAYAQAQDPVTKGVSPAAANAACAGVDGKTKPDGFAAAVTAYNTVDNTDDAPFSAMPVEWQKFIIATEDHKDYLAMAGLDDSKTITCSGKTAVFPSLALADDVDAAVCANARLDLIGSPELRNRVSTGLRALVRSYADARSDCPPPATTAPPPPAWTGATSFGNGLYQVGRDIPAGLFRTPGGASGDVCYYARLSSNDGSTDSIIANDLFEGQGSLTIAPADAFVSFSGGCVWTLDGHTPSNPTPAPAPPVAEEGEDNDSGGAGFSQVGELPTGIDTGRA